MDEDATISRESEACAIKCRRNRLDRVIDKRLSYVFVVQLIFFGDVKCFLSYQKFSSCYS